MIWTLLLLYQLKHWLADYPLQTQYMLGKFKSGRDWIAPLALHASVHAGMTGWIASMFAPTIALELALVDFVVHFAVDRVKARSPWKALSAKEYLHWQSMAVNGELTPRGECDRLKAFRSNVYFWWALGADQLAHHLTHYYIIWRIVS